MNVTIEVHYISNETKIMSGGNFPLRGKSKEFVVLEFWKWIKKQHRFEVKIDKVICDGAEITKSVEELIKQETIKVMNDNLPF